VNLVAVYAASVLGFRFVTMEYVSMWEIAMLLGWSAAIQVSMNFDLVPVPALAPVAAASLLEIWRRQIRGPKPGKHIDLQGHVVVVTGSNSGIGVETARALAGMGALVIMACRTRKTAEEARESITRSTGNDKIEVLPLDLGNFESVRNFVKEVEKKYGQIDVLVNNAGVMLPSRQESADKLEMSMQTNFLSVYLLILSLVPLLRKSDLPGGARVALVSSTIHKQAVLRQGHFDFEDMFCDKWYEMFKAYGQSKLGMELFKYELNRRLRDKGEAIQVNSLMPGTIPTGITRNLHWLLQLGQRMAIWMLNKTTVTGSWTTIYVATSPEVSNISGEWFEHCAMAPQPRAARNPQDAARLWSVAEKYTGFNSATVGL